MWYDDHMGNFPLPDMPDCLTRLDDGEVVLTGRRIGLYTLMRRHKLGRSAVQLAEDHDIPPAAVECVLAYCRAHSLETEAFFSAYQAELDRQYEEWKESDMGRRHVSREELQRRWVEKGLGPLPSVDLGPEFDIPL